MHERSPVSGTTTDGVRMSAFEPLPEGSTPDACEHGNRQIKSGVSKKTGKAWAGLFCPLRDEDRACPVRWLNDREARQALIDALPEQYRDAECEHGTRKYAYGTNARGSWEGLFCCLPKEQREEQCAPVWVERR